MTDQQIHEAAHLDAAGNALYANHRMAFIRGAEFARQETVGIIQAINTHMPFMSEQYMRHDYRAMWEIWNRVCETVGTIPTPGHGNV